MLPQVTFVLPASFQSLTDGRRNITLAAASVQGAVEALVLQLPELHPHVLDEAGKLRPFINLFVDNQQVVDLESNAPPLKNGSELLIIAALAGG